MGTKNINVVNKINRFALFCDNLTAQVSDEFKKYVSSLNDVCWYGLLNATDLWHPVDAGYAELLKVLINQAHHTWLDSDQHANRWYENTEPYAAKERRILITFGG